MVILRDVRSSSFTVSSECASLRMWCNGLTGESQHKHATGPKGSVDTHAPQGCLNTCDDMDGHTASVRRSQNTIVSRRRPAVYPPSRLMAGEKFTRSRYDLVGNCDNEKGFRRPNSSRLLFVIVHFFANYRVLLSILVLATHYICVT